ncbi:hypothetical protein GCK32_012172 [Trichostrongylus colubriformis]|uniref:Uncharacterized protein n=1 Tax=Trichostrongylus colubriformis TaxID=6319 RepID=A0AAN8IWR0_TRICO
MHQLNFDALFSVLLLVKLPVSGVCYPSAVLFVAAHCILNRSSVNRVPSSLIYFVI